MFRSFLKRHEDGLLNACAILVAAIITAFLAPPFLKRMTNGEITGWSDLFQRFRSAPLNNTQWIAIGFFLCALAAMVSVYFWAKKGGFYYWRYPMAKAMDEMNKAGKLNDVDVEALLLRIDIKADKKSQVAQLRAEVAKNSVQRQQD